MKVLVTGAKGFIGRNLSLALGHLPNVEVLKYDISDQVGDNEVLYKFLDESEFVFHLAGVNRPKDVSDFAKGNKVFTEDILRRLALKKNPPPVLFASSIQAALDNEYGYSILAAEEALKRYAEKTQAQVFVYRLANVFGKWARPNYNSAVATWVHNIARDLPIEVRDESAEVTLVYIDDVVNSFIKCLQEERSAPFSIRHIEPSYTKTLGQIVSLIRSFRNETGNLFVPNQVDCFEKKLYATYLSALPEDGFSYPLLTHRDERGSFTEILHTVERGQVSVNVSKPGITKGQHWHNTKHEKFLVVSGKGEINFRVADDPSAKVISYKVSSENLEVVRIPPGYTHNIVNVGATDMVTVMWANEVFDPQNPDTFRLEV